MTRWVCRLRIAAVCVALEEACHLPQGYPVIRIRAARPPPQGHAGTVPMRVRRDPMAASAEIIAQLERICNGGGQAEPYK